MIALKYCMKRDMMVKRERGGVKGGQPVLLFSFQEERERERERERGEKKNVSLGGRSQILLMTHFSFSLHRQRRVH